MRGKKGIGGLILVCAFSALAAWAGAPSGAQTARAAGRDAAVNPATLRGVQPEVGEVKPPQAPPRESSGGQAMGTGGPDAFGYRYIDSNEPGGPAFSWVDISATGTPVLAGADDDYYYPMPIGFTFNFYGTPFTQAAVGSNGTVYFEDNYLGLSNECIPGTPGYAVTTNFVAGYWDDLYIVPGSIFYETLGTPGSRQFVVMWNQISFCCYTPTVPMSYEIILSEADGSILIQYLVVSTTDSPGEDNGASATVGIEKDATLGLQYSCDTPSLTDNLAIRFYLENVGLTTPDPSQEGCPGPVDYLITLTNSTGADATFTITNSGNAWGVTYPATVGPVANGAATDFTVTHTIPPATPPGSFDTVLITATAPSGAGSISLTTTAASGGLPSGAVADGSFEGGSPNASWAEASTNFGTPLCTVAACGTGTGTGPRTGTWWAWFGGAGFSYEEGSVTQTVTIPLLGNTLSFYTEAIVCAAPADFLEVTVDGTQVFLMTGADASCGALGYMNRTADISAFADGGAHVLVFHSITYGSNNTNFFVDDVEILLDCPPPCGTITLSPATLPGGLAGQAYSATITASGGTAPYTFAVTGGALPAGLTLAADGTISGTPAVSGVFTFTVTATDSLGCTGSAVYTITLAAFNLTFFDDYGRSALCLNSLTGAFQWKVFSGSGIGTYAGTGKVTTQYNVLTLTSLAGAPWQLALKYYIGYKRAYGSFIYRAMRVASPLSDSNTANDPPVC